LESVPRPSPGFTFGDVDVSEHAWNQALRAWFYRPDLAERPAYLAVDEETLTTIAKESGFDWTNAKESLCRAARYHVSPDSPLDWWVQSAVRWKFAGYKADPPFLSILAITVLAATIVDDVHDRSYYRRLNQLLGLDGHKMPRYFDSDVQQLWTYLNHWLDVIHHGELGKATASNKDGLANVGWAQSQTLMKSSDRAKLPLFFADLGVQAGQLVDGSLLAKRLTAWSSGGHALSRRLSVVLQDSRLRELLAEALHSELATWDGTVRDEVGRLALKIILAFHERSGELQAAVQVPGQLAQTLWRLEATEIDMNLGAVGELQLVDIAITSHVLDGQPILARPAIRSASDTDGDHQPATLTLFLPHRELHLLCPDDRLARWAEVPSARLDRPHLVLVRSTLEAAAIELMGQIGTDVAKFRRIHKPNGWAAYRFTPIKLKTVDGPLAVLSPRGHELSALDGGLPISAQRKHYLTEGPPDLLIDLRDSAMPVQVDDLELHPSSVARLRLADLRLGDGKHSLSVGGVHYQFTLANDYASAPSEVKLSFMFELQDSETATIRTCPAGMTTSTDDPATKSVLVSGGSIELGSAARSLMRELRPPHVRVGGRHFALGEPGQAAEIWPRSPKWFDALPTRLHPHLVDISPAIEDIPFTVNWLLRASAAGVTVSAARLLPDRSVDCTISNNTSISERVLQYIADAAPEFADEADAWDRWKRAALARSTTPDIGPS
jgi:hypothetical protein